MLSFKCSPMMIIFQISRSQTSWHCETSCGLEYMFGILSLPLQKNFSWRTEQMTLSETYINTMVVNYSWCFHFWVTWSCWLRHCACSFLSSSLHQMHQAKQLSRKDCEDRPRLIPNLGKSIFSQRAMGSTILQRIQRFWIITKWS